MNAYCGRMDTRPRWRAWLLLVVSGALTACGAREEPASPMKTILVTGFGPFLEVRENPSFEALRPLEGAVIGQSRIVTAQLDVTYAGAPEQLEAAIRRTRPDLVLCLGVAGDASIRLESTARNQDTAASPDVAGEVRQGRAIRPGQPDSLPTRLPLARLRAALVADGFEVSASDDAGGYLCNHVFYELLTRRPTGLAGFIHVPPMAPPWDLARLTRALRRIVEVLDLELRAPTAPAAPPPTAAGR